MNFSLDCVFTIDEAGKDCSKIAKATDQNGILVILKDNEPKHIVFTYDELDTEQHDKNEDINAIASRILSKCYTFIERIFAIKMATKNIKKINEAMKTIKISLEDILWSCNTNT